jgi:predicted nucleotidyltransferase
MEAEKHITEFVEQLKQALGTNLECVTLFGSAVSQDFHADFSDINLLCIVRELSAATLDALAPAFHAWTKKKFPAPMVFSRTELERSADVFSIELLDISQRHRIFHGEDIFTGMKVPMDLHRVQVEHDLRTKLLTLRQLYMHAAGDEDRIRKLMLDSVTTFATLMRHSLIVLGEQPAVHKADSIAKLAQRVNFDAAIFLQLLDVRARKVKDSQIDVRAGFSKYLQAIDKVIQAVDAV